MFSNSKVILFLRRNSLELYFGSQQEKLEFPINVLNNLETVDLESYKKLISEFFTKLNLNGQNCLILLSDEVIFSKILPLSTKDLDAEVKQFLETVPFEDEKLVSKTIKSLDEVLILATNKDLYSGLISLLESLNWTIKAVVPLYIFKSSLSLISDNIDPQIAKRILNEHDLIESANFLLDSEGQSIKQNKSYPITWLLVFGLIIITVASFYMASTFGLVKNPLENLPKTQNIQPVQSRTPLPTEAPESATQEVSQASKDGLTVQVLNGSGITGQAAKVKTQLAALGFTSIETGNATGVSSEETTVTFSDKVDKQVQDEVQTELEKTYKIVTIKEATVFQFDIQVIIGTELIE